MMSYLCYTRSEGQGLVEVEPIVTLRFDNIHKITANRLIEVLEKNFNPFGWSSKVTAITESVKNHLPVSGTVYDPEIIALMPEELLEELNTKALLLDHKLIHRTNQYVGTRYLMDYNGERDYNDPARGKQVGQVCAMFNEAIAPYRPLVWHSEHLRVRDKLLNAIANKAPMTITGNGHKRW